MHRWPSAGGAGPARTAAGPTTPGSSGSALGCGSVRVDPCALAVAGCRASRLTPRRRSSRLRSAAAPLGCPPPAACPAARLPSLRCLVVLPQAARAACARRRRGRRPGSGSYPSALASSVPGISAPGTSVRATSAPAKWARARSVSGDAGIGEAGDDVLGGDEVGEGEAGARRCERRGNAATLRPVRAPRGCPRSAPTCAERCFAACAPPSPARGAAARAALVVPVQVVPLHQADQLGPVAGIGRVHAGERGREGVGIMDQGHRLLVRATAGEQPAVILDALRHAVIDAERCDLRDGLPVHRPPAWAACRCRPGHCP